MYIVPILPHKSQEMLKNSIIALLWNNKLISKAAGILSSADLEPVNMIAKYIEYTVIPNLYNKFHDKCLKRLSKNYIKKT